MQASPPGHGTLAQHSVPDGHVGDAAGGRFGSTSAVADRGSKSSAVNVHAPSANADASPALQAISHADRGRAAADQSEPTRDAASSTRDASRVDPNLTTMVYTMSGDQQVLGVLVALRRP